MTTRRSFLSLVMIAPVARAISATVGYGYVDVERWASMGFIGKRNVLCNGVDITNDCRWFDDRAGEAEVLRRDSDGRAYLSESHDGPAVTVLKGRIRVV